MFYTTGHNVHPDMTNDIVAFFVKRKFPTLENYEVEFHFTDLSEDGVKGWQQKTEEGFLIEIDNRIEDTIEVIKTLFHELIHCSQDIDRPNLSNDDRENEAYQLEEQYCKEFCASYISDPQNPSYCTNPL
tara:strand:+ start:328 stop:717 length:390 start_codon:yes stop_codon:yes gene_type:complete